MFPAKTLVVVFSAFFGLVFSCGAVFAASEEYRTVHHAIPGNGNSAGPVHHEFVPLISNYDNPARDKGACKNRPGQNGSSAQDWDPRMWRAPWTMDSAVRKLFQARIFERQYMRYDRVPVVDLGPAFYKLSDIDQERTLRLLTDQAAIFRQGYSVVELVDWYTQDRIGAYTPAGLSLN